MFSNRMQYLNTTLVGIGCFLAYVQCVGQSAMAQTKLAFFAGVENYERDGFEPLNFAEDDALELKAELDKIGFKTVSVVGKEATLAGLNRGLSSLYASSKKLKRDDVVLVFLSGHGVQKLVRRTTNGQTTEKEEPFFCPIDAHKNDISTLLNMNDLLERLKEDSGASNNIVLLDACRESLDKGKGIDGSTIEALPNKLALFFAAQSGHRSFESRKLKHGIFTHYLLEGLRGKAADEDSEITLQGLTSYVSKRVQRDSPGLLDVKESEAQQPNLMGNLRGSLLLGKASHSKPNVSLIPPGQKLSDGEKGRRREVAIRMLEQLKTQQKLADSDPAVAYIKGKIYGPKVLGFKLQDENDLVRYVAELQSLDQRTDTDLYRAKANQLIAYLKANEYNLKAVISEGKFRASPETFKIWEIYFSAPRSSTILAAFSNEVWQCLPMLVRPLLALTSEEQRRAELKSEFPLDATDSAILASLVGDYEHAIQQEHGMSHECYTVLAPVLNGDLPTAIKIAESWSDESNKNLSYALIVDQLLDEGRTQEAIQLFSRIDRSKNYGTMIGQVPLRMFNFHFYGSMPGLNLWTYLAGRIGDETIVDIDFLIGLVSDL